MLGDLKAEWTHGLAEGLRASAEGDHEEARRLVTAGARPQTPLVRCLVDNLIALILFEKGDYSSAQDTFEGAVAAWRSAAEPEAKTLEEFRAVLQAAGRDSECETFLTHLQEWKMGQRPHPLLEPWSHSQLELLGGASVEAPSQAPLETDWLKLIDGASDLVRQANLEPAAHQATLALQRAEEIQKDGLQTSLALTALSLIHFQMGDYGSSEACFQDANKLWQSDWASNVGAFEDFLSRLAPAFPRECDTFRSRLERAEVPFLNPWNDMGGPLLAGDQVATDVKQTDPMQAWQDRFVNGLRAFGGGNFEISSREFSQAVHDASRGGEPLREATAAAWVALASFRVGDYPAAKASYDRAGHLWSQVSAKLAEENVLFLQDLDGFLASTAFEESRLARERLLAAISGDGLPFLNPWGEHEAGDLPIAPTLTDPRGTWVECTRAGLEQFRRNHFERAEMEFIKGREAAVLLSPNDARVVVSENLMALSSYRRGDYPESEVSLERARRIWRAGAHSRESAAEVLDQIKGMLEESQLVALGDLLESADLPLIDPFQAPQDLVEAQDTSQAPTAESPAPAPSSRTPAWISLVVLAFIIGLAGLLGSTPPDYPVETATKGNSQGLDFTFRMDPGPYKKGRPAWIKLVVTNASEQPVELKFPGSEVVFRVSRPGRMFFLDTSTVAWEQAPPSPKEAHSHTLAPGQNQVYQVQWNWDETGAYVVEALFRSERPESLRLTPRLTVPSPVAD